MLTAIDTKNLKSPFIKSQSFLAKSLNWNIGGSMGGVDEGEGFSLVIYLPSDVQTTTDLVTPT